MTIPDVGSRRSNDLASEFIEREARIARYRLSIEAVKFDHPAQQDSCLTSFVKVCAANFRPSTIVR
jgi:hypothetical protein